MGTLLAVALRSWWAALVAVGLAGTATVTLAFGSSLVIAGAAMALSGALAAQGCLQSTAQWSLARTGRRCDATIIAGKLRAVALSIASLHVCVAWLLAALIPWLVLH